jgi:CRP/FNR family transcriptional regulator
VQAAARHVPGTSPRVQCERFSAKELKKGAVYDPDSSACFVIEGALRVEMLLRNGKRSILCFVFPGEMIKPNRVFKMSEVRIVATEQSLVVTIGEDEMRDLAAKSPTVFARRDMLIDDSTECMLMHTMELGLHAAEERVANVIYRFAVRGGTMRNGVLEVPLPILRSDLAHFLALETETVSRVFTRLRDAGIIDTRGRRSLVVLDLPRLREITPLSDYVDEKARMPSSVPGGEGAKPSSTGCPILDVTV